MTGSSSKPILAIALVAIAAVLTVCFFSNTWRTGDESRYYVLGKSIADGQGYVMGHLPIFRPENITPPVLPYVISLFVSMDGSGILLTRIFSALCFLGAVFMVSRVMARGCGLHEGYQFCAVVAGCFTVPMLTVSCWVMADMPYLFLVYSLLLLMLRYETSRKLNVLFLAGALSGLAYLTRSAGLAIFAGCAGYLLLQMRVKDVTAYLLGAFVFMLPWIVRNMIEFGAPDAYIAYLSEQTGNEGGLDYPWHRIAGDLARTFPEYFLNILPSSMFYGLFYGEVYDLLQKVHMHGITRVMRFLLPALIFIGWACRLRRPSVLECFYFFHLLLICAMPLKAENAYYLFPIFPLSGMYLVLGGYYTFRFAAQRTSSWADQHGTGFSGWTGFLESMAPLFAMGVAFYVLLMACAVGAVHLKKEWPRWQFAGWAPERYEMFEDPYFDAWANFVRAGQWLGRHAPENAVVASRKPLHTYVFSKRKGWAYHIPSEMEEESVQKAFQSAAERGPVYLIEDGFHLAAPQSSYGQTHRIVMDQVFENPSGTFSLVHKFEDPATKIWKFELR